MGERKTKLPAAYCDNCETIFEYEDRDLFVGELYCPACSTRALPENRAGSVQALQKKHKDAKVHGLSKA
jgi:hypothetical protein